MIFSVSRALAAWDMLSVCRTTTIGERFLVSHAAIGAGGGYGGGGGQKNDKGLGLPNLSILKIEDEEGYYVIFKPVYY